MTPDVSEPAAFGRITITCLDGEQNSFPALITSLGGGGILRVRVPRSLPEGTRGQVHAGLENSGTATGLYSCGANDQYWATIQIHPGDRRREPRIAVNTKARPVLFPSALAS